MPRIQRETRTLKDGTIRKYAYLVADDGTRRTLPVHDSELSNKCYRNSERRRAVASLQSGSSLLIVGEQGIGKTKLAEFIVSDLRLLGFPVALVVPKTNKETLVDICLQLGLSSETLEGKRLTASQLQDQITEYLLDNTAFLIWDSGQRLNITMRTWLEYLHELNLPQLLLARDPKPQDIFLRLPRIELRPLAESEIREIMVDASQELGFELKSNLIASLQQRANGNPMLARRVVLEEFLGLEELAPDHTRWFDATPVLIAMLALVTITRFIGLGLSSTALYLLGGILTVTVTAMRVLLFSLPREERRLGG
ncbi:MAG: AAA family ATPase [Halothece sp.]